jgi:hypothetical protein
MFTIIAALIAAPAITGDEHSVRLEHRGTPVDVTYRATTRLAVRQVGAVTAPGRPSTLRCTWRAHVHVDRVARAGETVITRAIAGDTPITGTRAGWCSQQRKTIAEEVASRSTEVREQMIALAERDRTTVLAEIDMHRDRRGG